LIRRLDHVAIAVADTDTALEYFRDRLGLRVVAVDRPPEVPVKLTYLELGNTYLQLVEPLDPEHALSRWLADNGDGFHHICFGVDDVVSELDRLGPDGMEPPPMGSGRGRPAGFVAGPLPHGVRVECTSFNRAQDVDQVAGWLKTSEEEEHGTDAST
jgi:methylmalonyl-CoA/ethylmalonyl-CoA epimerase